MLEALASGSLLLLLDQWSKGLVQTHAATRPISCGPLVRIRRVLNSHRMYARGTARTALVLVWCCALLAAILLRRFGLWFQSDAALLGLGVAFGGAAGNLADILRKRCVVDFIDLGWWPVFNLADVAILCGLLLAFWPRA